MSGISIDYNLFSSDGNNTSLDVNKQKKGHSGVPFFMISWFLFLYANIHIYNVYDKKKGG